ncbi:MAG: DUF167 domain-containing protein [bacterium]
MQIEVKVIARASKCDVIPLGESRFKVKLTRPALEGKANEQLIQVLADYFDVPKASVHLVSGEKSSQKRLKIDKD